MIFAWSKHSGLQEALCITCKAVSLGAKLLLVRQLSVQLQQRLIEGMHDGVYIGRAALEVPAAAQRDLLCASHSSMSTQDSFCSRTSLVLGPPEHAQSYVYAAAKEAVAAEHDPSISSAEVRSGCCSQMSAETPSLSTEEEMMPIGDLLQGKQAGSRRLACSGARSIEECSRDGRSAAAGVFLKVGLVHAV